MKLTIGKIGCVSKPFVYRYKGSSITFTPYAEYLFYELFTKPIKLEYTESGDIITRTGFIIKLYKTKTKSHLLPVIKLSKYNKIKIILNEDFNHNFKLLRQSGDMILTLINESNDTATYLVTTTSLNAYKTILKNFKVDFGKQ